MQLKHWYALKHIGFPRTCTVLLTPTPQTWINNDSRGIIWVWICNSKMLWHTLSRYTPYLCTSLSARSTMGQQWSDRRQNSWAHFFIHLNKYQTFVNIHCSQPPLELLHPWMWLILDFRKRMWTNNDSKGIIWLWICNSKMLWCHILRRHTPYLCTGLPRSTVGRQRSDRRQNCWAHVFIHLNNQIMVSRKHVLYSVNMNSISMTWLWICTSKMLQCIDRYMPYLCTSTFLGPRPVDNGVLVNKAAGFTSSST